MGWFSAVGGLGLGGWGWGGWGVGGGGKINHVQSIYFLEGTTNTILILAKFGQSCIPIPPHHQNPWLSDNIMSKNVPVRFFQFSHLRPFNKVNINPPALYQGVRGLGGWRGVSRSLSVEPNVKKVPVCFLQFFHSRAPNRVRFKPPHPFSSFLRPSQPSGAKAAF